MTPVPYAYGPSPYVYGPTVGPWFGPNYGPGFSTYGYVGVWGGSWAALPWYPGYGWYGMNFYTFPAPTLGPTPGAFSATGGYGIGGGVYGAQRDLPTIIPKGNGPRFATRDVRQHFDNVKANPQAAIDRAWRDQNWWRFR
ncbi:MAG: hypothetical protein U0798_04155 [Gemmataceae bacterium]